MKSKAEIIDALKRCKEEQCHCDECPYFPEDSCVDSLFDDVISLLNKSDFEVMKEILDRSKLNAVGDVGYYNELGHNIIGISGIGVDIEFDSEGNIL